MSLLKKVRAAFARLSRDEDGASAVEYAILVAVVATAVTVGVQNFNLGGLFTTLSSKVSTQVSGTTSN